MARLELQPDFRMIVVQTGLFLANLYIVNKLFILPFLRLKNKRDEVTVGKRQAAKKQINEIEAIHQKIETRLSKALIESRRLREEKRNKALVKHKKIVSEARKDAEVHIRKIKEDIERVLQKEYSRIPEIVGELSERIYQEVVKK